MLTVVIRPAANPDLYLALHPGISVEAKRLLFIQSSVCRLTRCADYQHITFECVSMDRLKQSAVIIKRDEKGLLRFGINNEFPQANLKIGDDHYTIEFAELRSSRKETP